MASFSQIPREDKRRIASEIHDNLAARALDHTIALRSIGAEPSVVEEGKRLMAPLTTAVRLLRSESRSRATKRDKKKGDEA